MAFQLAPCDLTRFSEPLTKHPIMDFSLINQAKTDWLKQKDLSLYTGHLRLCSQLFYKLPAAIGGLG